MKLKSLMLIALFVSTLLVAVTLSQPPGYELEREWGSWCDEMLFRPAYGPEAQMMLLMNHAVDAGWPPTPDDIQTLIDAGYMMSTTPGFDIYFYAINCREQKAPLNDSVFRTALAYCMDKEVIYPTIYGPLMISIYNFAPPAQAFWCNPDVTDAFPRFNLQTAIDTLIGGGYIPVLIDPNQGAIPGNIDYWFMPDGVTPIRDLEQAVPTESALGIEVSKQIEEDLWDIGLKNIHHTPIPLRDILLKLLTHPYMNWDLVIGIGISLSQNPFLYEMFHVESIPFCNLWGIDDPIVNYHCKAYRETLDLEEAQDHAWAAEERLLELMPMIPMASSNRWTCCTGPYDGQPGVLGWVNMMGHGGIDWHNIWGKLYSRREYPDGTPYQHNIWLMDGDLVRLNPLTSTADSEMQVLSLVYSTLLQKNPYTHELMEWCVSEMPTVQPWNGTHREVSPGVWVYDPSPAGSPGQVTGEYMMWTLRKDMTWHDKVPVTSLDVEFCLDLLVAQNNEKYRAIHTLIHDVNVVDDYTFEVYYKGRYPWAIKDISDVALLAPKHIWKPYIAGPDGILWTSDDRDHRFWIGHEWTDKWGYSAPIIETVKGPVQLTHLQGNGPFIYPLGGWTPGVIVRLIRWGVDHWHYRRILRGDNNLDGICDLLDLYAPLYAMGSEPGMPKWLFEADMANPSALIDGRDIEVVYNDFGYRWWPYSMLPP